MNCEINLNIKTNLCATLPFSNLTSIHLSSIQMSFRTCRKKENNSFSNDLQLQEWQLEMSGFQFDVHNVSIFTFEDNSQSETWQSLYIYLQSVYSSLQLFLNDNSCTCWKFIFCTKPCSIIFLCNHDQTFLFDQYRRK